MVRIRGRALLRSSNQKVTDYALMPSIQAISRPGSTIRVQPVGEYRVAQKSIEESKKNG